MKKLVALPSVLLALAFLFAGSPAIKANPSPAVLITGVYYNPFVSGEASEAVQLRNVTTAMVPIAGWQLSDGNAAVSFPTGASLFPGQIIWMSKSATAFSTEFGFLPDYEYGGDSDVSVPNMAGSAPAFNDAGDQVYLFDKVGAIVDAMAYGNGSVTAPDWNGPAVQPYAVSAAGTRGQILYRKMQEGNGMPTADSNAGSDWAQDPNDAHLGKKVRYPGWDLDEFWQTTKANENTTIKYCVAPDNLFNCVRDEIHAATATISVEMYSLDNAALVDEFARAAQAGIHLSILLDGGAMVDQGKWACQQIEAQGGQCWIMASKPQSNIHKRYADEHGKWMIVDHRRVLIGSENMGSDAMPSDDKRDGTFGSRGGYLVTLSPTIVSAAQRIMDRDLDPANHSDVRRWGTNTDDFPPFGFVPAYADGGNKYPVQFPSPFMASGVFPIELVQCPENCLRGSDAVLGMVARAGGGATLLVEQLYETTYWGVGSRNHLTDPNVRLEAYVAAARRGARVRLLLDSLFDTFSDPRSNYATCAYVNQFAPRYDIECRIGNPTGRGIHSKMILLQDGASGLVHLGSINGSEASNKLNRELATQVESLAAYQYWQRVFDYDWAKRDRYTTQAVSSVSTSPKIVVRGKVNEFI